MLSKGVEGLSKKEKKEKKLMDTDSSMVIAGGRGWRSWRRVPG